jgi:hypothetical protein
MRAPAFYQKGTVMKRTDRLVWARAAAGTLLMLLILTGGCILIATISESSVKAGSGWETVFWKKAGHEEIKTMEVPSHIADHMERAVFIMDGRRWKTAEMEVPVSTWREDEDSICVIRPLKRRSCDNDVVSYCWILEEE